MSPPKPLFVDTNAFVALVNEDDRHHEAARAVRRGIDAGVLLYGPLFTTRYVLSETATTLLYRLGHRATVEVLTTVRESSTFNVLDVTKPIFDRTAEQFAAYDDQEISFIDHLNTILCDDLGIEHIFAFEDGLLTLGMTRVPVDSGEF